MKLLAQSWSLVYQRNSARSRQRWGGNSMLLFSFSWKGDRADRRPIWDHVPFFFATPECLG
ncbi:hypothetical protein CGRA01v4_04227 [Colletotrichum graminicola]|nr:hypothetical protein CGRA01v4_04227 [Colletotrichum graminicola]